MSASPPPEASLAASLPRSAGNGGLRADIEAALKPGARLLRLSPELEERYDAATWRGRNRSLRVWLIAIALIDVLCIGIDRAKKLNGFSPKMLLELAQAFTAFEREEAAWVAVLFAHGANFGLEIRY